jgi:hypothetical protein
MERIWQSDRYHADRFPDPVPDLNHSHHRADPYVYANYADRHSGYTDTSANHHGCTRDSNDSARHPQRYFAGDHYDHSYT